jgi:hypothetical protein
LLGEIKEVTQENSKDSWGDWESRIEVSDKNLDSSCKIQ